MNNIKLRRLFLLVFLLTLSMACVTVSSAFVPAAEITISPKESSGWDENTLKQASQIIDTRLKDSLKGRYEVKVTESGQISVALYNTSDVEIAKKLATETGAVIFVDSLKEFPKGYELGGQGNIILTQQDMKTVEVSTSSVDSSYQIAFTLTNDGAQKMMDYSSNNIGRYLSIVRDGIVITSPRIQNAITDGKGVIYGKFNQQEASELAAILKSPPLPIQLKIVEVKTP